MGSRAGLSCLWPPTRQSFAPSPPQFQLFSHSDEFSEACLLFVIVRKCEQEGLGKTVQTGGKGRVHTVLVHLPSSSLVFPCLAGLKINVLWPHSLAGAQCFWGLSATRLIADSFCFLIYRSPKGSRAMHFFYSFFFFAFLDLFLGSSVSATVLRNSQVLKWKHDWHIGKIPLKTRPRYFSNSDALSRMKLAVKTDLPVFGSLAWSLWSTAEAVWRGWTNFKGKVLGTSCPDGQVLSRTNLGLCRSLCWPAAPST